MSDLTILPLPRLDKTLAEVRSELFAEIELKQDQYAESGWLPARLNLNKGVIRGMLEMEIFLDWQFHQLLQRILSQAVPLHSTGEWLEIHCNQIGLSRKEATKAKGLVRFIRAEGENVNRNIPVSAGRIVRTLPDGNGEVYRYVTAEPAVLPSGEMEVPVPVVSEEYGALANAGPGQICELVTPVSGIGEVANDASWLISEGANRETDKELLRRYILAWHARAGITAAAYKSAALSVTGVSDVAVSDQHPRGEGTIDIIVKGSAGLPTDNLLAAVSAAVGEIIVINHDYLVLAPQPVPVDISFVLQLISGDADATTLAARNFLQAYFGGNDPDVTGITIGEDVVRDRLASAIITIPGVKKIVWNSPAGDLDVPPNGLALLNSLNISSEWVAEK